MSTNHLLDAHLIALHHAALRELDALVVSALSAPPDAATPCAGWSISDLLAHELGQVRGFAAALVPGERPTVEDFRPLPASLRAWSTAATALQAAVGAAQSGREVFLPELHPTVAFRAERAVAFRTLDSVVHAWDIARSLGLDYAPGQSLGEWVAAEATHVPLDRRGPEFGFAEPVPGAADDPWPATLRLLGRRPDWTPE